MTNENIERIIRVAKGLGEVCNRMCFVGGAVAFLYADNKGASEVRPTMDIDCVTEISTYGGYDEFEKKIRTLGFVNDVESEIICRWKYKGETIDIMPADENILGFSNVWYEEGYKNRKTVELDEDQKINIFPVLYYIASKIEALNVRGGKDWRLSHDFEDIVYVFNNRDSLLSDYMSESNVELKKFVSNWCKEALKRDNFREEVECCLPYGDEKRIDIVIGKFEAL